MIKRAFDVVVAAAGLVAMSPLLMLIALAIKFDSRGPVIFRQERVGRYGRRFRIHKFRTMITGAPGLSITTTLDPRVTRVGRILRRAKLDELPQLIDVLTGSMSLVGPRPEVPRYVSMWPKDLRNLILTVRPGITDPATAELRNESDLLTSELDAERHYIEVLLPLKTASYAEYVRAQSFAGDLRILIHTARRVVEGRRGARAN
jgi:lipopolysaccharide/colanic/teichoic acid biosynthesis glycosyltransferase